jgi:glycosyltransferase involved in cell wall biosynthesis
MTIAIDCRHIDSSGIGVYFRECLPYLLESGGRFLLLGGAQKLRPIVAEKTNVQIVECGIKPFSLKELFLFPRSLLSIINKCDIYYSPFFNIPGGIKAPVYTTIHDIIFPDMPQLTSKAGLAARMWFYKRAVRHSRVVFTVSQFSASRILHYFKEANVVVTYNAPQSYMRDYNTPHVQKTKTIIFIGNIKKHKGLPVLLDAFFTARKAGLDYKLLIVGSKDNFRTQEDELHLGSAELHSDKLHSGDLQFTGYISNRELARLLAEAALLVQPSLYEGFCYPPLEAMMLGTHALISDIPVLREVYAGFPVTFFKAGDASDLSNKLLLLLQNKEPPSVKLDNNLKARYDFRKVTEIILREINRG